MSDDMEREDEDEAEDAVAGDEPEFTSDSFVVAMEEAPAPDLRLARFAAGAPEEWFVSAKNPRAKESKITDAGLGVEIDYGPAQRRGDKQKRSGAKGTMRQDPNAHFLAKCRYQITGFALPVRVKSGGDAALTRHDNANGGDNKGNLAVYEAILYAHDQGLRVLLEDYLDWVAGRPLDSQFDFDDLLVAPGR